MERLKIKHIQHYPIDGENPLKVLKHDGKTILNVSGILGTLIQFKEKTIITYAFIGDCKPILRPISDLYKEIDGKIALVELVRKITGYSDLKLYEYDINCNISTLYRGGRKGKIYFTKNDHYYIVNYIEAYKFLSIYGENRKNDDYSKEVLVDQSKVHDFLSQNHYDWKDNLIDSKLAVDINSLE
jgi:hypothetical protein